MNADITFVGFLVAAITGLGTFTAWAVRAWNADMAKSRDRALTIVEGQTLAINRLTEAVERIGEQAARRERAADAAERRRQAR